MDLVFQIFLILALSSFPAKAYHCNSEDFPDIKACVLPAISDAGKDTSSQVCNKTEAKIDQCAKDYVAKCPLIDLRTVKDVLIQSASTDDSAKRNLVHCGFVTEYVQSGRQKLALATKYCDAVQYEEAVKKSQQCLQEEAPKFASSGREATDAINGLVCKCLDHQKKCVGGEGEDWNTIAEIVKKSIKSSLNLDLDFDCSGRHASTSSASKIDAFGMSLLLLFLLSFVI